MKYSRGIQYKCVTEGQKEKGIKVIKKQRTVNLKTPKLNQQQLETNIASTSTTIKNRWKLFQQKL